MPGAPVPIKGGKMKKSLEVGQKAYTVKELAEYLQCHAQTVYDRVREGVIPHYRIGRSIRFVLTEVLDWCRQDVRPKGGKK